METERGVNVEQSVEQNVEQKDTGTESESIHSGHFFVCCCAAVLLIGCVCGILILVLSCHCRYSPAPVGESEIAALDTFPTGTYAGERKVWTVDGVHYPFRWCPAGLVHMAGGEFLVRYTVTIKRGFWILETEVTQAMWKSVMSGENPSHFPGDQNPVEQVSWHDCVDFCRKFSSKIGIEAGLPTEAQWEYAATASGIFHTCDLDGELGWNSENSQGKTHPVARLKPNEWGLYDMLGNVFEWCSDAHLFNYKTQSVEYPKDQDPVRAIRGGSWYHYPDNCTDRIHSVEPQNTRGMNVGFRIILAGPAPDEE